MISPGNRERLQATSLPSSNVRLVLRQETQTAAPPSAACTSLGFGRFFVKFPLRQIFVEAKAGLGVLLRFMPEELGVFRFALGEHFEARFHLHVIRDLARGRP